MKLKSYYQFLNEATLSPDKIGLKYTVSSDGRKKIQQLSKTLSPDCIFTPLPDHEVLGKKNPTSPEFQLPNEIDTVLFLRATKFEEMTWGDFIDIFNIDKPYDQLFIYKTNSKNYPFAVIFKGNTTTVIKQLEKSGPTARGDYFRETAFIVTLGRVLWQMHGIQPMLMSKRGIIQMVYDTSTKDAYVDTRRAAFRNKYELFMEQQRIADSLFIQCKQLVKLLGSAAKNIVLIQKNSVELAVCKYLRNAISEERDKIEEGVSNYEFLPDLITLSKWNPADIWLGFSGYEWMLSDKKYKKDDFDSALPENGGLNQLNDFLGKCISEHDGIIGVSLKQQLTNPGGVYSVNIDRTKTFVHKYSHYDANPTKKLVNLIFTFEKLGGLLGKGQIDVRTFDTKKTSPISIEVKGSDTTEHMSGKAGSYIKYKMPKDVYKTLVYVQKSTDLDEIKDYVDEHYDFCKPYLRELFYNDLAKESKTGGSNSRLQAVLFTDWFESISDQDEKTAVLGDLIRFAKSESDWSAPHLIVK